MKADRPQKHKARADFSGIYRRQQHFIFVLDCFDGPRENMRAGIKRTAGVAAAMAIALHTILWAAVAPFAASSVDPFTVICHSEASGPADQAPVNGTLPPAHACDHCNLCSATAPAAVPDALVLGQLAPAKLLLVLEPVSLSGRNGITASPHRARGPPFFA